MFHILEFFFTILHSIPPKINNSSKTGKNRFTEQKTDNFNWPKINRPIDKLQTTDRNAPLHCSRAQWHHNLTVRLPITSWRKWPIKTNISRALRYHQLMIHSKLWLWRWLPHRLSKCQPLISQIYFWPADDGAFSHPSHSLGARLDKLKIQKAFSKVAPKRKLV